MKNHAEKSPEGINDPPAGDPLAAIWHYQPWCSITPNKQGDSHEQRDGRVFAARGNWAAVKGLMTAGEHGYLDSTDTPDFTLGCRCYLQWIFNLRSLPTDMLTPEGAAALTRARAAIQATMKPENQHQNPSDIQAVETNAPKGGFFTRWFGKT